MNLQNLTQIAFVCISTLLFNSISHAESYDTEISFGLGKLDTSFSDISLLNFGFTKKLEAIEIGEQPFELNGFYNPVSEVQVGIRQWNANPGTTINFFDIGGNYYNPKNGIIAGLGLASIHSDFTDENTVTASVGKYLRDNAKIVLSIQSGSSEDDDDIEYDISGSQLLFQYVGMINNKNSLSGTLIINRKKEEQKNGTDEDEVDSTSLALDYYISKETGLGIVSTQYNDSDASSNGVRLSHYTDFKTRFYATISKLKEGNYKQDKFDLGVTVRQ